MAASTEDIERWKERAKKIGATHIISVWDTFDNDDYPVYVMPEEDLEERKKKYDKVNMQRINEVFVIGKE